MTSEGVSESIIERMKTASPQDASHDPTAQQVNETVVNKENER